MTTSDIHFARSGIAEAPSGHLPDMRLLLWHVHGSWTTAFVQGPHEYVVPVLPDRGEDGRGRARTWQWPESVTELPPERLRDLDLDAVVIQRPHELDLAQRWLGRRPGRDVPAVFLEHNTPLHGTPDVPDTRHPLADQQAIPIVHVTGFNQLFWDCGSARTSVIEHGVVDPGYLYTGELPRAATAVNDPVRRGRSVGTDLLPELAAATVDVGGGLDVFGMRVRQLPPMKAIETYEDLPQDRMHQELARRRVYVHTARWTSLGLSLIEAMHLGMPVVAVGATEAPMAVPPEAGVVSTRREELAGGVRQFLAEPGLAATVGRAARLHALERYGLARFLADWDDLLAEVTS